jgi:ATP-dependent Lhr-like helicase
MLGSFAWRILAIDRDTVTVAPATPEGADPPFWRNAWLARRLQTGIAFGKRMRELTEAGTTDKIIAVLTDMGLDEAMAVNTERIIERQIEATGVLPDDTTLIVEHFSDESGDSQLMIHSIFGRQVNAPLAVLLQHSAQSLIGADVSVFEDDDGILLMTRGKRILPERLLHTLWPAAARPVLEAVLPGTPLFNMTFRYNAGRALMMGVRKGKRQPLWVQRLRSTVMLDSVIKHPEHPLIRETKRECFEDYWDLPGLEAVLEGIQGGRITVRELRRTEPSPLSLQLRRAAEAQFMYDYYPSTKGINRAAEEALTGAMKIKPAAEQLARVTERKKLPDDEKQLHSLLMMEGDVVAGELDLPLEWFETLAENGRALYTEPGLWIAAEQAELYSRAFNDWDGDALQGIARRALRYRGAMDEAALAGRYCLRAVDAAEILRALEESGSAVSENGWYYHADLYEYARRQTIDARRRQIKTRPARVYAAYMADRLTVAAPPAEQLAAALASLGGRAFPPQMWESVILPARVNGYRGAMLDNLLASGGWYWKLSVNGDGTLLSFHPGCDTDWEREISSPYDVLGDGEARREQRPSTPTRLVTPDAETPPLSAGLSEPELRVFNLLLKRGASFMASLEDGSGDIPAVLMRLAEKGLARADSFVPVRQWMDRDKTERAAVKQKVRARVLAQTSGRWEILRPLKTQTLERQLERAFRQVLVLCKETAASVGLSWPLALTKLRAWEYTGQARRGYFIEGLSGTQFIHEKDFNGAVLAFETLDEAPPASAGPVTWLAATDPLQLWGRLLAHRADRAFICVQGTAVALRGGLPVALLEKSGAVLRVFDADGLQETLNAFIKAYMGKKVFPDRKRLTVKQYPAEAESALRAAGFKRVMMDYVAYQS